MGRSALDEDAIRLIEEHNPEVEFDWTRILKGQGVETKPVPPPGRERFERGGRRRPDSRGPVQAPPPRPATPPLVAPAPEAESAELQPPAVEPIARGLQPEAEVADEDESVPALDRAGSGETGSVATEPQGEMPLTAAHARLGSEGLLRLRARHAEVLARISERVQDAVRQDELKTQAERLNPDTWVTDAEVSAGLEEYETVFEALRTAVGGQGRGRRPKRRRGGGQPEPAGREPEGPKAEDS